MTTTTDNSFPEPASDSNSRAESLSSNTSDSYRKPSELSEELRQQQAEVIEGGDPLDAYEFAINNPGADVDALGDVILAVGDFTLILLFVQDVRGVDVVKFERFTKTSGNAHLMYGFATEVRGADVRALEKAILTTDDAWMIYRFAKDVAGSDVKSFENRLVELNDPRVLLWFARDVVGANVARLEKLVEASEDEQLVSQFASEVDGASATF